MGQWGKGDFIQKRGETGSLNLWQPCLATVPIPANFGYIKSTSMSSTPTFTWKALEPLVLESGAVLADWEIAYCAYGALAPAKDNVVWICHALTGNAIAEDWWHGLVGPGKTYDPAQYFIVCANILGSCYGSTGPASTNPATGRPYALDFPLLSIRDMVAAHEQLRQALGLERIHTVIGGSMGGQQALEWAVQHPTRFDHLIVMATNARHSAWGIAFNESQRMAILADQTLLDGTPQAGRRGLEAARAVAMLSYRAYATYHQTQTDPEEGKLEDYRAAAYQRYQGHKLWQRFNVFSYLTLTKAMDTHHLGRGRGPLAAVLAGLTMPTLVVSIDSDGLFPPAEQAFLAAHVPKAQLVRLPSSYGHDGFLVEFGPIGKAIEQFYAQAPNLAPPLRQVVPGSAGPTAFLPGTERF